MFDEEGKKILFERAILIQTKYHWWHYTSDIFCCTGINVRL